MPPPSPTVRCTAAALSVGCLLAAAALAAVITPTDAEDGSPDLPDSAVTVLVANAGWGIDAIGVTDGGADTASQNAPGQDCRRVVCVAP